MVKAYIINIKYLVAKANILRFALYNFFYQIEGAQCYPKSGSIYLLIYYLCQGRRLCDSQHLFLFIFSKLTLKVMTRFYCNFQTMCQETHL